MCLVLQPENHEWSLDGAGEDLDRVAVKSDLEAIQLCYRLELWDAEFLVRLRKDEEIVRGRHLELPETGQRLCQCRPPLQVWVTSCKPS